MKKDFKQLLLYLNTSLSLDKIQQELILKKLSDYPLQNEYIIKIINKVRDQDDILKMMY